MRLTGGIPGVLKGVPVLVELVGVADLADSAPQVLRGSGEDGAQVGLELAEGHLVSDARREGEQRDHVFPSPAPALAYGRIAGAPAILEVGQSTPRRT